jgi:hypothetical protein
VICQKFLAASFPTAVKLINLIGVIFALTLTRPNLDPNQRLISDLDDNELWPVIKTIAVLVASGIGMSVIWLNLMNSFPFTMIYVGLVGKCDAICACHTLSSFINFGDF